MPSNCVQLTLWDMEDGNTLIKADSSTAFDRIADYFSVLPDASNTTYFQSDKVHGRDYATFNPYGSVNHHTAGPRVGIAPSLGICINGRSGLPGPLCNVHQQRNDVVNVVAAGVANHAGRGGWQGMSGNQSVFGLEIEHCGYPDEPFDERRQDICQRIHEAEVGVYQEGY